MLRGGPSSTALNALLFDGGADASDEESAAEVPSSSPPVSAADTAALHHAVVRSVAASCSPVSPPGTYVSSGMSARHYCCPVRPSVLQKLMFKSGDDLRQDQLIIQLIHLMDSQLKRVGLDLCLMPYRVLATSTTTGVMELVLDSRPVSAVFAKVSTEHSRCHCVMLEHVLFSTPTAVQARHCRLLSRVPPRS